MPLSLKKNKQSGFTLIELMVVMAIIAILATAGLSAYAGYLRRARDSIREQDIQKIHQMLFEYYTIYGGIPVTANASRNPQGYTHSTSMGWDMSSIDAPGFMSFLVTSGITSKVPVDPINNMSLSQSLGYAYKYYCYDGLGFSLNYKSEVRGIIINYVKHQNPEFPCL